MPGLVESPVVAHAEEAGASEKGVWLNAPCYNNCSCGSSRCLNRIYVEDGVPLKTRSDEAEEDSYAVP